MTTKNTKQDEPRGSNRRPPWRDHDVGYAVTDGGDTDDARATFMTAVRRFRARHGLSPVTQSASLLNDDDLQGLRATVIDRPLDFDDVLTSPSSQRPSR